MAVYFVAGGLLSSAWVNAVQLLVLIVGFIIAVPLVLAKAGGLLDFRANPGQVCPAAWEEGEETLAPSLDLVGKL